MTTFHAQHGAPAPAQDRRAALRVTWSLPRGIAGKPAPGTLHWLIEPDGDHSWRGSAMFESCEGETLVAPAAPAALLVDGLQLLHVVIPGALGLVLDGPGDSPRLVYAWTSLLERLGVSGGCVEPPVVAPG